MIYPAIDLKSGNSIRLYQGDYDQSTLINADPLDQARSISASGINALHVVDLDGAKDGQPVNAELVTKIAEIINGTTEIGGGIRTEATIESYLTGGVQRVILGSVALKDPEFTTAMLTKYGSDRITIGIDGLNGLVATDGWLNQSSVKMAELINAMAAAGANRFIVTDTATDGTLAGPNFKLLGGLHQQFPDLTIVASGGVRDVADVLKLQSLGLNDVIVGKALAAKQLTLKQVAEVNQC
ncbi:1-(5-phosphoribosyl)-5-[(5-phosphoribosylamino)methylideneamino]imidazole-4-carboxamide isomerase [Lactobacillus sp. Sy-1]|uniref:1-(5-phosphoribosyl)-5-[(5- phosphoribosylamino)methylideneamino]imidazole-4- carboxamide isomerase n=1 Tax=Lactobacillus sp. Sy-1 TaxID=2109645 RepID=UPI001C5BD59A|nr:1-(5-phosphoribosyl)-5-[(5-phosphoribosylamino)methylideneamino]imidazole-4-carboxamide isomerase [Lactobacillus sp. Sy-1]MBW1606410.1 1-(5-phosphoribosyl)-5-[(5-phosphoribosylamino)methylideneamino]imidazole-4-carboxamide isomerase [Lactobacillus sp. Sy-1]